MSQADRDRANDIDMDTESGNNNLGSNEVRYFMSTPEPEMSHHSDEHVFNSGNSHHHHNALDLFSPISLNNNNNDNFNNGMTPDVGKGSHYYGEFTIELRKVNGSLGFTLYSQVPHKLMMNSFLKLLGYSKRIEIAIQSFDKLQIDKTTHIFIRFRFVSN